MTIDQHYETMVSVVSNCGQSVEQGHVTVSVRLRSDSEEVARVVSVCVEGAIRKALQLDSEADK